MEGGRENKGRKRGEEERNGSLLSRKSTWELSDSVHSIHIPSTSSLAMVQGKD